MGADQTTSKNPQDDSTIYALSSGAGRSAVAVIRVSGPGAGPALEALAGPLPAPRVATLRPLQRPGDGVPLDQALVLWFPAPHSFTGEDAAEFQVHGGRAVVSAVLAGLGELEALRPAEPGEFARRAFGNGKLDLTAVEGLADLINAETEAQRRQALRQAGGALARLYDGWRERLLSALAHLEADLEFPDEELNEHERSRLAESAWTTAGEVGREIEIHLADQHRGERLRDGVYIALLGAPNVGKSSLLNLLARRDAAIVADTAGTTRDVIEVHLDLGGVPVTLADTAGLREVSDGTIEQEGISRALKTALNADFKIILTDGQHWPILNKQTIGILDERSFVVANKIDLCPGFTVSSEGGQADAERQHVGEPEAIAQARGVWAISAKTGEGIDTLLAALERAVADYAAYNADPGPTRARHRHALEACAEHLGRLETVLGETPQSPELAAEDLRLGCQALGRITGRIDVEELLDVIFADFCVGK